MELAAHWHRCQNLPKKRVNTSLLYRERDDPVKERGSPELLMRSSGEPPGLDQVWLRDDK
jgi:hypothetical protein